MQLILDLYYFGVGNTTGHNLLPKHVAKVVDNGENAKCKKYKSKKSNHKTINVNLTLFSNNTINVNVDSEGILKWTAVLACLMLGVPIV